MIKHYLILSTLFFALFFGLNAANAESNYIHTEEIKPTSTTLQGYTVYVPAGITVNAVLSSEINSQSAVVGQTINALLIEDLIYNGIMIAPNASTIGGTIVSNKKATYGIKNAQTHIKFTTITTPYNNVIPISATILTNDNSGVLKGATFKDSFKEYAKDTAIGVTTGAVLGTAIGAIKDNSLGKSALYGGAIGAGLGIIKAVSEKGEAILIPANSQITLHFNQPITLGAQ